MGEMKCDCSLSPGAPRARHPGTLSVLATFPGDQDQHPLRLAVGLAPGMLRTELSLLLNWHWGWGAECPGVWPP